jgi:hypothetical protein
MLMCLEGETYSLLMNLLHQVAVMAKVLGE